MMKRYRLICMMLTVLLCAVIFSGCGGNLRQTGQAEITDMTGRTVKVDIPAEKVVVLTASCGEILYAIGAGESIVGRGEYCDYPTELLEVPMVQSGQNTNVEQIIALAPQVVLMGSMAQTEEQISALESAGIACVVTEADTIDGVYDSINLIGKLMGKEQDAEALVSEMKTDFDTLKNQVQVIGEKPTVYFEVSPLEYGLWTAGKNTFMDEIATMLGLENAFGDVTGWAQISEEQVLERDPDYIVTVTMYYGEGTPPEDEILGRTGWSGLSAVQNRRVFLLSSDAMTRPGPRLVDAAEQLFDYVYRDAAGCLNISLGAAS